MNEVVTFLQANPVQYLATVGRDGKAKCRPFMFAGALDGKLWFCTNTTKDVYRDMQANPYVELSVSSPDYAWLRLSGEAVFSDSMAAKELCLQNPIVQSQYGDAANPIFTVFWLRDARAIIADFSGEPPRTYTLRVLPRQQKAPPPFPIRKRRRGSFCVRLIPPARAPRSLRPRCPAGR